MTKNHEGVPSQKESDKSVEGLLDNISEFVKKAVQETYPASVVSLEAIRKTDFELARTLFKETVIDPAREVLKIYSGQDAEVLFGEIEARLRQESITQLYHEVDTIVASRLMTCFFDAHDAQTLVTGIFSGTPPRDGEGKLTSSDVWMLEGITKELTWLIAKLASVRERRLILYLTGTIVGKKTVEEATKVYGSHKREILLHSISLWLEPQNLEKDFRAKLIKHLAQHGSDTDIEAFSEELMGNSFLGEEAIRNMVLEVFTGIEHIEF